MFELAITLLAIFGFMFILSVGYPLMMLAFYPIYRYLGGKKNLKKYMKSL